MLKKSDVIVKEMVHNCNNFLKDVKLLFKVNPYFMKKIENNVAK